MLTLPRGKRQQVEQRVALTDDIEAPLAIGDSVGTLTLLLDGELLYQGPVVALQAVEPGGFFARLWDIILMWLAGLFGA